MMKDYINKRLEGINNLNDLKGELKLFYYLKDEVDLNLIYDKFKELDDVVEVEGYVDFEYEDFNDIEVDELDNIYKDFIFNYKIFN